MIKLIEASNFRSLKYISQTLGPFHVLIGANATGKTTFLDVIKFIADIVNMGIDKAVFARVAHFDELTFAGKGGDIELAIEAEIPKAIQSIYTPITYSAIRYEIKIGIEKSTGEIAVLDERIMLLTNNDQELSNPGSHNQGLDTFIFNKSFNSSPKIIAVKKHNFNANYTVEPTTLMGGRDLTFLFGTKNTALTNLPYDENQFPTTIWFKNLLLEGVDQIVLDSLQMRNPSASGQSTLFKTNGSNLAWIIENLRKDKNRFELWLDHIQTAFPDITDIITIERAEDRKRYLKVKYKNNIDVPSWLVSDGTLRFLALTITAYLSNLKGIFLIEEPENGIHPKAIESMFLSLSSVYSSQILLATHSSIILGMVESSHLLCFAKTPDGVTTIVSGNKHPKLKDWKGNPNLNLLFASGILS